MAAASSRGGRFLFFLNHPLLQTPNSGWIDDQILDPPEQYFVVFLSLAWLWSGREVDVLMAITVAGTIVISPHALYHDAGS